MREYIISLVGVILISGIISMISPDTEIKKYISLVVGFCILAVIVKPIGEIAESISEQDFGEFVNTSLEESDYREIYEKFLTEGNEKSFSANLKQKMVSDLQMKEDSFDIISEMKLEDNEYKLKSIAVRLYGKGVMTEPDKIQNYIKSLFGLKCEIIYG